MTQTFFTENTKMADAALTGGRLIRVLSCLGVGTPFGEKTIGQVCGDGGLSTPLVVMVLNLHARGDYTPDEALLRQIPLEGIVDYLGRSHRDYLEVRMPRIMDAVLSLPGGGMLASFCEKYRSEVEAHFRYEEQTVFPYVHRLLTGERPDWKIGEYARLHSDIDGALEDLKNIIVKYLPPACTLELSRPVLGEIFAFEHDLRQHTRIEDTILIPLVERLDSAGGAVTSFDGVELTAREQEVLAALALGLSNKQIADRLFISTHTVISHRKNIARKTGFRTAQGLTFFALHSGLVSPGDFL
jgi:regulator of cell morphogenesis and NO signaling